MNRKPQHLHVEASRGADFEQLSRARLIADLSRANKKSHFHLVLHFHLQSKYLIGFLPNLRHRVVHLRQSVTVNRTEIKSDDFFRLLQICEYGLPIVDYYNVPQVSEEAQT
jgi:hypothetical protein